MYACVDILRRPILKAESLRVKTMPNVEKLKKDRLQHWSTYCLFIWINPWTVIRAAATATAHSRLFYPKETSTNHYLACCNLFLFFVIVDWMSSHHKTSWSKQTIDFMFILCFTSTDVPLSRFQNSWLPKARPLRPLIVQVVYFYF